MRHLLDGKGALCNGDKLCSAGILGGGPGDSNWPIADCPDCIELKGKQLIEQAKELRAPRPSGQRTKVRAPSLWVVSSAADARVSHIVDILHWPHGDIYTVCGAKFEEGGLSTAVTAPARACTTCWNKWTA